MIYRAPSQTKKGKKKENERSVFQLSSLARQCRFHSSKFDLKYGAPARTPYVVWSNFVRLQKCKNVFPH